MGQAGQPRPQNKLIARPAIIYAVEGAEQRETSAADVTRPLLPAAINFYARSMRSKRPRKGLKLPPETVTGSRRYFRSLLGK